MSVSIHHIETVLPAYEYRQEELAATMERWLPDPAGKRIARQLFRRSGIETRYSVLPDFAEPAAPVLFKPGVEPSTQERNRVFIRAADELVVTAARRALANAGNFAASEITHVVTASCTGFYNPGPDYRIVTQLGLSPATERYHVGFMGCYAAFPALRMAQQFCQAQPDAVVLVVCLELCTLHLHLNSDPDTLLANALFADGVAAAIVSARPPSARRPVLAIKDFYSALASDGEGDMAWEIGDKGFNITLSSYVPDIIAGNIDGIVEDLFARSDWEPGDVDRWAVHPGGKAILDKTETALALQPEQLAAARATLRDYGNMSSATVLFVLQRLLLGAGPDAERICAMAFGPGLTIETGLLELIPARQPVAVSRLVNA
jgi:predicted naringenin-chalcone synthase